MSLNLRSFLRFPKYVFFSRTEQSRWITQSSCVLQMKTQNSLSHEKTRIPQCIILQQKLRNYSTAGVKETNESAEQRAKKEKIESKKKEPPKVLVIDEKGSITAMSIEDAGKLAKKKRLQLVEVDPVTESLSRDKQVYKLMTASEFYGEDVKHHHHKVDPKDSLKLKDEKTVIMKATTNDHDVLIKVKQITKWVMKNHPVKVLIGQPGDGGSPENVYKIIENAIKDQPMRIIQKVVKSGQIRFQLLPPKQPKSSESATRNPSAPKQSDSNSDKEDKSDPL